MFDSMRAVRLIMPRACCFYRGLLSAREQSVYDRVCEAIAVRETSVKLDGTYDFDLDRLVKALRTDQVMLFFLDPEKPFEVLYNTRSVEMSWGYSMPMSQVDEWADRMDRRIRPLLPRSGTELQREVFIHDRLQDLRLKAGVTEPETAMDWRDHSIVGPLLCGHTVCSGASRLFSLLCNMSGVRCLYVSGTAQNNQGVTDHHAWNIVKLGNTYAHVDAFWDLLSRGETSAFHNYPYFNLSDERISVDHTWDRASVPSCPVERYSYFALGGADCPTPEAFEAMARDAVWNGKRRLCVRLGFDATQERLWEIIQAAAGDYPKSLRFTLCLDEAQRVFDCTVLEDGEAQ